MSKDVILKVHCPANVYQTLRAEGFDKDRLSREAREGLAVRLYGEHRLSLGKSAELAALPIVKFMDLLRSLNMPVVEYGEEEYAQDLKTISELKRMRRGRSEMTKIHAQLIGDKALLPRSELEQLVELARQSEKIELEMNEDDVPTLGIMRLAEEGGAFNFWKGEGEDIYSAEDSEPV